MQDDLCRKGGGPNKFFRLSLARDSLEDYYRTNFSLLHLHKYSLHELENMIPWEREIYITLLVNHIKEENEKLRQQLLESKSRR